MCVPSVFIAIIPTHLLCQMQANPLEAEFRGTIAKLKQRNKISSLLVYVLHKPQNLAFSRRSLAKTGKKCTKERDARAKLLFCLLNQWFFFFTFSLPSASLDRKLPIVAVNKLSSWGCCEKSCASGTGKKTRFCRSFGRSLAAYFASHQ